MTTKELISFCRYCCLWLAAVNEQHIPSYTTSVEKPLAPGYHMLHKKDDCSFRGKQKLHTFSALLLLYGTRPGNSSEGQFAGLQSSWWNSSFPSFLEAHCKGRRKSNTRCEKTKQKKNLVVLWLIHSSHDDCSYKSTRPGESSQVQVKISYQKLLNLSAQANVSPHELIPGQLQFLTTWRKQIFIM